MAKVINVYWHQIVYIYYILEYYETLQNFEEKNNGWLGISSYFRFISIIKGYSLYLIMTKVLFLTRTDLRETCSYFELLSFLFPQNLRIIFNLYGGLLKYVSLLNLSYTTVVS